MLYNLVLFSLFAPVVGAIFVAFFMKEQVEDFKNNAYRLSIFITSCVFLVLASFMTLGELGEVTFNSGFMLDIAIDGIAYGLMLLTAFMMPLCLVVAGNTIELRVREFLISFLILETCLLGSFAANNIFMFYVFFEASLIPMFLIIGVWGGERRIYASYKLFIYTLLGSLLMLVAMVYIYVTVGSAYLPAIMEHEFSYNEQWWLFLAFFASFAVKVPMVPFHTWLPDAHVEAPTVASVVLAAILLKLGGYGLIRFNIALFPDASVYFSKFIVVLSVIAIVYTSMVAFAQTNIKRMIAYSSVAHMGFVTLGLFAFNENAWQGAYFQMISHGFISAGLFLVIGVVYSRTHDLNINSYGGLARTMPKYAIVAIILAMANLGLPGTSGFIGEFMTLLGAYSLHSHGVIIATLGVILSAAYMLRFVKTIFFGPINSKVSQLPDLTPTELWVFVPLVVAVIGFGVYPKFWFELVKEDYTKLLTRYEDKGISSSLTLTTTHEEASQAHEEGHNHDEMTTNESPELAQAETAPVDQNHSTEAHKE